MGFFFETLLLDLGALGACLSAVVYIYFRSSFTYWKKRKVPYVEPTFPFGNFQDVLFFRKSIGFLYRDMYRELEGEKYGGVYTFSKPGFMFRDPDIIKNVLIKDFSSFHDRGFHMDEEHEPLSGHLFILPGKRWRNLRMKLTPTFTSGKIKIMFQTLVECGKEMGSILEETALKEETIEIKDILARYSTDVISSCAFGIQCNCLKNPDAEFRQWGRKIFLSSPKKSITGFLSALAPSVLSILKLRDLDQNVSKYFQSMVQDTVNYREKNGVKRNDFMQLLIQIKNNGKVEEGSQNTEQNGHGIVEDKSGKSGMCETNSVSLLRYKFPLPVYDISSTRYVLLYLYGIERYF
jgi:cytochrome P450 family 6